MYTVYRLSFSFFYVSFIIASFVFGLYSATVCWWPLDFSVLDGKHDIPSIIVDDQGRELARLQRSKKDPIDLTKVPIHVINAFIATEDRAFFSHHGISWRGIARSLWVNCLRGRRAQGASTITQQLVRLLFFDAHKTLIRKVKEQWWALVLEGQHTKEHILEAYLNHIYFGCGLYGIEAASYRFWHISAAQLSIAKAAMLAGIIRSPVTYNPLISPHIALKRRNVVLSLMHACGFITDEEYQNALEEKLMLQEQAEESHLAPAVREAICRHVEQYVGKGQLYGGGYVIQTTLNRDMQREAQHIMTKECERLRESLDCPVDGGLISINVATGAVKALVAGADAKKSYFNRALHAKRQLGSVIKPIIYATALEQGASLTDVVCDEPYQFISDGTVWRPRNDDHVFRGPLMLAQALARSNNIIAAKTIMQVTPACVAAHVRAAGLTNVHEYPSLALGCVDTTVMQAAGLFNIFANNGVYVQPYFIASVKDRWGAPVFSHEAVSRRIFPAMIVSKIAAVLEHVGHRLCRFLPKGWRGQPFIAKTGTTNDSRTCWLAGSTPALTTVVYIGCDDNRPLGPHIYSSITAFPIWAQFMQCTKKIHQAFVHDPRLREVFIDAKTGEQVAFNNAKTIKILC